MALFETGLVPVLFAFWFSGVIAAIYLTVRLQSRR
jgi:hypothetical protein